MEYSVDDHLMDKDENVIRIYNNLIHECEKFGPVIQAPKKASIHLDAKKGFAGVYVRKKYINLHVHTNYIIDSSRIEKVEKISANRFKHIIRIELENDIDKELVSWLRDAYVLKS